MKEVGRSTRFRKKKTRKMHHTHKRLSGKGSLPGCEAGQKGIECKIWSYLTFWKSLMIFIEQFHWGNRSIIQFPSECDLMKEKDYCCVDNCFDNLG